MAFIFDGEEKEKKKYEGSRVKRIHFDILRRKVEFGWNRFVMLSEFSSRCTIPDFCSRNACSIRRRLPYDSYRRETHPDV